MDKLSEALVTMPILMWFLRLLLSWQTRRIMKALAILLAFSVVTPAFAGASAGDTVRRLQAALLQSMREANTYPQRVAKLAPLIRQTHDMPRIARITLGRHWRSLNATQRKRFDEVFFRLSVSVYASRFKSWDGERFVVDAEKPSRHGRMLVKTRLLRRNGKPVHLDYLLRKKNGRWRIINVIANGVSDLALKRADYSYEIRQHGFEALISRLKSKIALRRNPHSDSFVSDHNHA